MCRVCDLIVEGLIFDFRVLCVKHFFQPDYFQVDVEVTSSNYVLFYSRPKVAAQNILEHIDIDDLEIVYCRNVGNKFRVQLQFKRED